MSSYNLVVLMGNLTRDPELRYTPSGAGVCTFAVAVNRVYTGSDGERKEDVTYVDVVCWKRLAEVSAEYLHKGSPVFIEGRLQQRSWETDDGQKRYKLEVVARSVKFLGSGSTKPEHSEPNDDDVPF